MIKVKLINKSNNPNPSYETTGAAGVDLRAFTEEDIVIKPMERKMIHTGLYMQIPEGYEGSVRPRSGLAIKNGITVINTQEFATVITREKYVSFWLIFQMKIL